MTEIDVEDLILELKELKLRVARLEHNNRANTDTTSAPDSTLSVGDRVRIKNKTRKPQHWPTDKQWTDSKERTATVTKTTPTKIYFTTDNGTQTWRAPHNLQKIQQTK
jgi:hypothetical protein